MNLDKGCFADDEKHTSLQDFYCILPPPPPNLAFLSLELLRL